jgi:dihydrofolate reductase
MRLVATEYLSLDGIFEEPGQWSSPWFGEDAGQFKWAELQASDALLLGRKTYEGFAAAWPSMTGTGEFGEKMNSMNKYVVSSTLDKVDWTGSQLITGNVADEVHKLKEQPGRDLLLSGSAQLVNALLHEGLIDVYRIMLYPVVLGKGKRLFADGVTERTLDLTATQRLSSGVIILEYEPASKT